MEPLLNMHSIRLSKRALDQQEECPITGEYVLPEYCQDIAVILKCFAYPRIQNRQWSSDQLLVDGTTVVRVLYLDEERRCVRSLEFMQPFSCYLRGASGLDNSVSVEVSTKYLNCRALGPRRVEVRGAVTVAAIAEQAAPYDLAEPSRQADLYTRCEDVEITTPCTLIEKILTINDSLEFDSSLPPAEMLLGGECRAVIKECKLLAGKAIVKGYIYVHQLYTDSLESEHTHCLNFIVPFSQILDAADATEGLPCKASVQFLSDTERCGIGPDGQNTMLEISVKLLLQVQVYRREQVSLLGDAFHCHYPLVAQTEKLDVSAFIGQRFEETKLSLQLSIPRGEWRDILDVYIASDEPHCECENGKALVKGRLQIGLLVRDADGELGYHELFENYTTEYVCEGNDVVIQMALMDIKYRVVEDKLELVLSFNVCISVSQRWQREVITDLKLQEPAYSPNKAAALLYFADAGETVWNIARICRASPDAIRRENALTDEQIEENCVLLVPL